MAFTEGSRERIMSRLVEVKRHAVRSILPKWDHVDEPYFGTIVSFVMSYTTARSILDFCNEAAITPSASRILIVGPAGGRDYHWLKGFGYEVDTLDLGHHPWGKTTYVGDACLAETWSRINEKYDLVIMCDVLEHLPEDYAALGLARKVMKSDGYLFLSVPYAHDIEDTHVRAYTYVTLTRLLAIAGYETLWHRKRPGGLETSSFVTILNYAIALAMPTPKLGGDLLRALLRLEYLINERTRNLYSLWGRSPQRGVLLAARATPTSGQDYASKNRSAFIPVERAP